MNHRLRIRAVFFLSAVLLGTSSTHTEAQDVSYSLLLGFGSSSWSGPFIQGGKTSPSLGAVGLEWDLSRMFALRTEVGVGARKADLGLTGLFEERTTLSIHRAHVGVSGRFYMPVSPDRLRLFVEGGAAGWLRMMCDIDTVGGPGFFGGETVGCDQWAPDSGLDRGLLATKTGATILLGLGGHYRNLGLGVRYDGGGRKVIDSSDGAIRVSNVAIVGEWVFRGR